MASAERSFHKLKLIKTYLRATSGEERLSDLAMISIGKAIAFTFELEAVVNAFAQAKVRKCML